jgi:tRNA-splicing endonuclease subunit Sen2
VTSEQVTQQRRIERQQTKWERARKEREAIDQRRSEEAESEHILGEVATANVDSTSTEEGILNESDTSLATSNGGEHFTIKAPKALPSPIGPLELLSLPNSPLDLDLYLQVNNSLLKTSSAEAELDRWFYPAPVGPMQLLALPNSLDDLPKLELAPLETHDHVGTTRVNGYTNGHTVVTKNTTSPTISQAKANGNGNVSGSINGLGTNGHASRTLEISGSDMSDEVVEGSVHSDDSTQTLSFTPNGSALTNGNGSSGTPKIKRRKSVRFSLTVEKNTFIQSEPLSPERAVTATIPTLIEVEEEHIQDKEHYQLTMEEAFFLSYSLGALTILDPRNKAPITNENLLNLFRKSSYFSPVANPGLSPDDPFMLNYVVYHHYRSLGWCVRGGAKFSCDFMLYNRGPVFSHAEFAVIILPSYSDEYWSSDVFLQKYVKKKEHRTWAWMHCINRVITQVKKSLVLVYVDIPKPLDKDSEKALGVDGLIQRYQVREFIMKRWQINRERSDNKRKP